MKKHLIASAAALLLASLPAQAGISDELRQELATSPDAFARIAKMLGCGHKFSEESAADMFGAVKGLPVVATGEVTRSSGGVVSLKVLPGTLTSDVLIKLTDARVAYDLEKGQRLSIRFTIKQQGGCFLPFSGDGGQIVRVLR